jgi:hypothetical protein
MATLDAGFGQKGIVRKLRARQADDLVCLKGNRKKLQAAVRAWFETRHGASPAARPATGRRTAASTAAMAGCSAGVAVSTNPWALRSFVCTTRS